jgi:NADH-quinone oxidoreductase subunit C
MDIQLIENLLKTLAPEAEVVQGLQFIEVNVPAGDLKAVASEFRANHEVSLDFLYCMTGVDYGEELGVVYHLRSTVHQHSLVIRTKVSDRSKPEIDTVSDIWRAAEFHENEIYDLLGICFIGHPGLRRLFLDADTGYPLRKDFVDEVNIVTK